MTSETYSPSLNSIHRGLDTEVQESAPVQAMGHSREEFERVHRITTQLALMNTCLQRTRVLHSSLGTIGTAFTLPAAAFLRSVTIPTRTVSVALALPVEAVGSLISGFAGSVRDSQPNTTVVTSVEETPRVKHRGWKDYIDSAEYEARLDAVTPRSANNEAEDYVRPTPRGRIRTIRRS